MKVALIGATGFVGRYLLQELISRNHHVTAIARHPENKDTALSADPKVTWAQADVMDLARISSLMQGQDAVISAYNAGWTNPDLYEAFMAGAQSIQKAVQQAGVKRLIIIGGAGSLFTPEGTQLVDSPEFPKSFFPGAAAARDYLKIIQQNTSLDWTFVSPAIEMNKTTAGQRRGVYRTGLDHPVFDSSGRSWLSVEDLAMAITDEMENPHFVQQRFTVAY